MMADAIAAGTSRSEAQGGRRPRRGVKRSYRVEFSLTDEEFELLEAAAARAGRSRGAYAAEAALAAARGIPAGASTPLAELLRELIRASGLVRRIGVNLNQAVARLNATVPPAFFFDDYNEQAGLLQEQVELLALVRDARISSAQLRAMLELSPQARQAIISLVEATARDDTRRQHGETD